MQFEKGEKSLSKGGFELGSIASKSTFYHNATGTNVIQVSLVSLGSPNHTLVGGVSVNSPCQQGMPLALFSFMPILRSYTFPTVNISKFNY